VHWKALSTIDAIRCPIILPPETSSEWIILQAGTILACWGKKKFFKVVKEEDKCQYLIALYVILHKVLHLIHLIRAKSTIVQKAQNELQLYEV
jgi:hypothetical protein